MKERILFSTRDARETLKRGLGSSQIRGWTVTTLPARYEGDAISIRHSNKAWPLRRELVAPKGVMLDVSQIPLRPIEARQSRARCRQLLPRRLSKKYMPARALFRAVAMGCRISWASEAANSPMMLSRFTCARSDSS
jgi:hypothetical protein